MHCKVDQLPGFLLKHQEIYKPTIYFEINLDRLLPKGLIPLDVLHNIKHKQPQEMLIPLLNVTNLVV